MPEHEPVVRVLMLGPDIESTPGGMSRISQLLLSGFAERRLATDVELTFAPTHAEGSAWTKIKAMSIGARALWRCRHDVDLVHLQVASGFSVERKMVMAVLARLLRIPSVVHVHGADTADDYAAGARLHRWAYRALFASAAKVLLLGNAQADWVRQTFPQVSASIVPNFSELPAELVPLPERPTLVFVGRLGERKGVWDLLEALRQVAAGSATPPNAVLLGDGDVEAVRRAVADDEVLRPLVNVAGWADSASVGRALDDAWFLTLPSHAEGLPMAVLEAMGHGRAVIATNVGATADAVRPHTTGYLCEPGDVAGLVEAIDRLCEDRSAAEDMGRRGRELAEQQFSEIAVMGRLRLIYLATARRSSEPVQLRN